MVNKYLPKQGISIALLIFKSEFLLEIKECVEWAGEHTMKKDR